MANEPAPAPPAFSVRRTLKLGSFHIGSAFADILVTGVWNRILISDLAISAAPVALLASLRYFMAPLTIWIGHRSDTKRLWGSRRLSYIYLGRLFTWLSLPLLPLVIRELGRDAGSLAGWLLALLIFVLYGLGTLVSGSPFLALVRESAPSARQGLAVVMVQTVLLFGFAVVPILYAITMPDYSYTAFWRVVALAMIGTGITWSLSVWGEERARRATGDATAEESPPGSFRAILSHLWGEGNTRLFFGVLAFGSIALFSQDAILEPFGADLFGLSVGETTRFNAYYGVGVLLAMVAGSYWTRRWLPQQYTQVASGGLAAVAVTLGLLVVAGVTRMEALLAPGLFAFGLASGVYTVGGVSLMMAMTTDEHAGAYLGLWSMAQLVFRGVGITLGGVLASIGREWLGSPALGYTSVFVMEMIAACLAILLLYRVQRMGYLFTPREISAGAVLSAAD